MATTEFKNEIKKALNKLSDEEHRKVLALRYGITDGYEHTQEEVSKILGMSVKYVKEVEIKALYSIKHPKKAA